MNYDRIILELMDRVSALESEILELKTSKKNIIALPTPKLPGFQAARHSSTTDKVPSMGKDKTQYLFQGQTYGKNRLVLAVVQEYANENSNISAKKLVSIFDKKLQGYLGVVREEKEIKKLYTDYERRFFTLPGEVIHTKTGDCIVCNQWGKFNIDKFITRAKELGFEIEELKK